MATATKSIQFVVSPQAVPRIEPVTQEPLDEIDESAEFGDVSAETREMLEGDFFASLRGSAS
jgi:hypothetical protein